MARKYFSGVATIESVGDLLKTLSGADVVCFWATTSHPVPMYSVEEGGTPVSVTTDLEGNFGFWIDSDWDARKIKIVITKGLDNIIQDNISAFETDVDIVLNPTDWTGVIAGATDLTAALNSLDGLAPGDIGAEPANSTIMKEGEDVSLLNNDADYQSGTEVGGLITTHSGDADAHHAQSHTADSHSDQSSDGTAVDAAVAHSEVVTGNPHNLDATDVGAEPSGAIATHAGNADAHHAQSHDIASHSDTDTTGPELDGAVAHAAITTGNPHNLDATDVGAEPSGAIATHAGDADAHHAQSHTADSHSDQSSDGTAVDGAVAHAAITTGNPHNLDAADVGAEPADSTIMKEGEDVSLLNNDADYQSGTEVGGLITTHAGVVDAHHPHTNKAQLDLVSDGDHDVRSDNPHEVTAAQAGAIPDSVDTVKDTHIDWGTEVNQVSSVDIPNDVSNFDGKLSNADIDVQKALDTLDDHGHIPSEVGMTIGDKFFPVGPELGGSFGDFAVKSILSNGNIRLSFPVPNDFGTLISAEVITIPAGTNATANIDLYSDYGAVGEAPNNHEESDLASTYALVAGILTSIDVSGVLTGIALGDYVGILINQNSIGAAMDYIGLHLKYNRAST